MLDIIAKLANVLPVIHKLPADELEFLKKYIEAHLVKDFGPIFHEFINAQIGFIEDEFEKI